MSKTTFVGYRSKMTNADLDQPAQLRLRMTTDAILLCVGFLFLCVPTYVKLDERIWNIVGQGHGPIMIALAAWLAYQRLPDVLRTTPAPSPFLGWGTFLLGLGMYFTGVVLDVLMLEVAAQIPLLASLLLLYRGLRAVRIMWFALFFMLFVVPLPAVLVDAVTGPLKAAVSTVAEEILFLSGYPIGRAGVTLTIGPYQLLVADACAGLNSIFALEAIGVFYMSVMGHKSVSRNIAIAILILPISFISNVIRVIVLVLVTYYFGDAAGQGFVHDFAGILLFMVATVLTILADAVLGIFYKSEHQR